MAILYDTQGNELLAPPDRIGGITFADTRSLGQTIDAGTSEVYTSINGQETFTFDARATAFSGTLVLEGSMNGTSFYTIPFVNMATQVYTTAAVLTGASTTLYQANVAGYYVVRVRCSAYTSGAIVLYMRAGVGSIRDANHIPYPTTSWVTNASTANTSVTVTLPAAGAGLYHYITHLDITRHATALLSGTATLTYTTTNLPGSPAWSFGNAMAAGGTQIDVSADFSSPLKSSVANTATTFVAPAAGAAVLTRINVGYFVGA